MAKIEKPVYTIDHPFVRSIYNLGDYEDSEHNTDPSLTDPSQDEPIEKLVARLMRGEFNVVSAPVFDSIPDNVSLDEAFANIDPSSVKGFDMADIPPVMDAAGQAARQHVLKSKVPADPPAAASPAPAPKLPEQRQDSGIVPPGVSVPQGGQ